MSILDRIPFIKASAASDVPEHPATLEFTADVGLQASGANGAPKIPTFEMIAYSGGMMTLAGWNYPVVVDLQGIDATSRSLPILRDHDQKRVVGHSAGIEIDASLKVRGTISGTGADAGEIVANSKNGFSWQASIGAKPNKIEFIAAGKSATVNGKAFDGPFYIARKTTLREISFVAIGADLETATSIAATQNSHGGENTMPNPNQPDTLTADRARVKAINAAASKYAGQLGDNSAVLQLRDQAIDAGWDVNQAELEMLRASRMTAPAAHTSGAQGTRTGNRQSISAMSPDLLTAGAMVCYGHDALAERSYGADVCNAAADLRIGNALDLCRAALRAEHKDPTGTPNEVIRAAFSTQSLSVALGNLAEKSMADTYKQTPATWRSIARIKSVRNFKENTANRVYLKDASFLELGPDGEIKHASPSEENYTFTAKTWARMFGVTRTTMINDDLGAIPELGSEFGRQAIRKISDEFWRCYLANAGSFFSVANANLITDALDADGIEAAILKFRNRVDADGMTIDIAPAVLAVGPSQEFTARALLRSGTLMRDQTSDRQTTANPLMDMLKLEVEPRLENTSIHANASATIWSLFADPGSVPTIIISALNGRLAPIVESDEANFNQLGMQWRAYVDFGVDLADERGAVRSSGDAGE